jgi:hypothetical protein
MGIPQNRLAAGWRVFGRGARVVRALALAGASATACRRAPSPEEISAVGQPAWLLDPCAPSAVDDFGWSTYLLRDVKIRVPGQWVRQSRRDPFRMVFRRGASTLNLWIHRNAVDYFDGLALRPRSRQRLCEDEISGYPAHVVSFWHEGAYTFAVRWPVLWSGSDAGKWLVAVVAARTAQDATELRSILLNIDLPTETRPR